MGNRGRVNVWNWFLPFCGFYYAGLCLAITIIISVWVIFDAGIFDNGNESRYVYTQPVPIPTQTPQTIGVQTIPVQIPQTIGMQAVPVQMPQAFGVQSIPAMQQFYYDRYFMDPNRNDEIPRININVGGENSQFEESFEEDFGAARVRGKRRMPVSIKRGY